MFHNIDYANLLSGSRLTALDDCLAAFGLFGLPDWAGWRARHGLPGAQGKDGRWQGGTPARCPFPDRARNSAPFSFLPASRGLRREACRIRDAALLRCAPDPAQLGKEFRAPDQTALTLPRQMILTTPAPAARDRSVRLRPRVGGNGRSLGTTPAGVDKFSVCQ